MSDQAHDLRRLVRRATTASRPGDGPRLLVVAGAKGGVGATTVAVNLTVALAQQGCRGVLVDADPAGGHVGTLCRLPGRASIGDVLAGRRSVAEAIEPGPGGINVLAGRWGTASDAASDAQERILAQLEHLAPRAELVVLDVGSGPGRWQQRFWQAADAVLLVTTPELTAVMDAYASIKLLASGGEPIAVQVLVNRAPYPASAAEVHARVQHACRRFLGREVCLAGSIPPDAAVIAAGSAGRPLVLASRSSPAVRQFQVLAHALAGRLGLPLKQALIAS